MSAPGITETVARMRAAANTIAVSVAALGCSADPAVERVVDHLASAVAALRHEVTGLEQLVAGAGMGDLRARGGEVAEDTLGRRSDFDEPSRRASQPLGTDGPWAEPHQGSVSSAKIRLDLDAHEAFVGARSVHLTAKEFAVLAVLLANADRLVPYDLLRRTARIDSSASPSAFTRLVSNVRRALGGVTEAGGEIRAVRGVGYRFVRSDSRAPAEASAAAPCMADRSAGIRRGCPSS